MNTINIILFSVGIGSMIGQAMHLFKRAGTDRDMEDLIWAITLLSIAFSLVLGGLFL